MIWYIFLGFLAAFGLLCILWILFGFLLPGSVRCRIAVICPRGREIATIRRFCLLREFGLLRFELVVINSALNPRQKRFIAEKYPFIRFCSQQTWLFGVEGRQTACESRTGDPPGNNCRSGISEL